MERKFKVWEFTTKSFGKGYVLAGSKESAIKKALKDREGIEEIRPEMTSHYDNLTKSAFKKKYGRW